MAADRIARVQLLLSEVVIFQELEFIHNGFSNTYRTGLECLSKGTFFHLERLYFDCKSRVELLLSAEINGFQILSRGSQIIKVFSVPALTLEMFVK